MVDRSVRLYHRGATIHDGFDSCMYGPLSVRKLSPGLSKKPEPESRAGTFGTKKWTGSIPSLAAAAAATTTEQHTQ